MQDRVTIIAVTHNNLACLSQMVTDIREKTTYPYELLVVDNGSTDPEVRQYLRSIEEQDTIRVIGLESNIYYFPAVNIGIRNSDPGNRYVLILNDDVIIESNAWIQDMIDVLESGKGIAYVGDFMRRPHCPPFGGWIDGWCMLFQRERLDAIGLFDEKYVWWYGPADYAVRTYKCGYRIKDIKREGDRHGRIRGVIRHIGGQTFKRLQAEQAVPEEEFFPPDFRYEDLLLKHDLPVQYAVARIQRLMSYALPRGLRRLVWSGSGSRAAIRLGRLLRAKLFRLGPIGLAFQRWYQARQIRRFLDSDNDVKLHLGCGREYRHGYLNIDVDPSVKTDLVMSADDLSPFPSACADVIESYHLLQHFTLMQARATLREWFRVLKPGGLLLIELPNLAQCVDEIGDYSFSGDGFDVAMSTIFGPPKLVSKNVWQIHKWGWTRETLGAELENAGFEKVRLHDIRQSWREAVQFNKDLFMQVRATKAIR